MAITVFIVLSDGTRFPIHLSGNPQFSKCELMSKIFRKTGIPEDYQKIVWNGMKIEFLSPHYFDFQDGDVLLVMEKPLIPGETYLKEAVSKNNIEAAKLIIEEGLSGGVSLDDLLYSTWNGRGPLDLTILRYANSPEMLELLVGAGASIDALQSTPKVSFYTDLTRRDMSRDDPFKHFSLNLRPHHLLDLGATEFPQPPPVRRRNVRKGHEKVPSERALERGSCATFVLENLSDSDIDEQHIQNEKVREACKKDKYYRLALAY